MFYINLFYWYNHKKCIWNSHRRKEGNHTKKARGKDIRKMKVKNQKTLAKLILTNMKENEALVIYKPASIYYQNINFKLKRQKAII